MTFDVQEDFNVQCQIEYNKYKELYRCINTITFKTEQLDMVLWVW